MGTTLTAAYVGEDDVTIAHVGDSRLYRLRDGELERLTDDHSLVEELVRQGKLTPEEAEEHPQRSIITRALGPEAVVEPDTPHVARARRRRLPALLRRPDVDGRRGAGGGDPPGLRVAARRRAHADRRRQRGRRARQHHRRPVPARGGRSGAPSRRRPTADARGARARDRRRAAGHGRAGAVADARRPSARRAPPAPARTRRRRLPRAGRPGPRALSCSPASVSAPTSPRRPCTSSASSNDGFVTLYRGLPYDLPAGIDLYQEVTTSPASRPTQLTPAQRRTVTAHKLRSSDDAARPRAPARDRRHGRPVRSARNRELLRADPRLAAA